MAQGHSRAGPAPRNGVVTRVPFKASTRSMPHVVSFLCASESPRWSVLRPTMDRVASGCSYAGVYEVQAIQYFIEGYRYGTLLKHKLMCSEPTTLSELMAKADKYATDDSVMRIKVTAVGCLAAGC
ncbi:Endoglucanase 3 [Hordeum vulgare]|nr:Endoglucanase 3 [Hordeum vulgare]